jgi:Skp family chaperone for outer membrane proteins
MKLLTTLLIFLLISFNANSNEQIKIRFVYMDYIFKNSSAGKKISKNIIEKRNKVIKKSKDTETKLSKQKADILAKQKILEKNEFEQKVISHQKDVEDFQNKRNKDLQDISKSNVKMTTDFLKKVDKILLDYANENKIDLILKKETLIVTNSKLDITKDILSIVEKKVD